MTFTMLRRPLRLANAVLLVLGLLCMFGLAGTTESSAQEKQVKKKLKAAAKKAKQQEPPAQTQKKEEKPVVEQKPATPAPLTRVSTNTPAKVEASVLAGRIDHFIETRLASEQLKNADKADDAEFLRRVYLDIVGVVPPAAKVKSFLDSKEPDKRAKLIDELLASSQYGKHMADIWDDLLIQKSSDLRRLSLEPFFAWLEENFNNNKPWDKMVSELLTAEGTQDKNGAVTYFLGNPTPDKVTDNVTRLFLGVQLQCAQCHNHPFTGWKQNEYWGMAAFFFKVRPDNPRRVANQGTGSPGVVEAPRAQPKLPESAKRVPPKFLQGEQPKLAATEPYRPALARWLTGADNPYFAKAMANRMWAHLFGRGIVNPVDDMHENNAPSHPELLQTLADQFRANEFDVKYLLRAICNSQTYQRSSKPLDKEDEAGPLFGHMALKVLTPGQLYDSLMTVVGPAANRQQRPRPNAQQQRGVGNSPRDVFVASFNHDDEASALEYQAGIPQALRLMNSGQFGDGSDLIDKAMKVGKSKAEVIETLYLAALARRPSPREVERLTSYLATGDARKAYADILWAVLNSSEFAVNH